jgi:chorismate synthase
LSALSPGTQGLRWKTAGESHGPVLVAFLEGLPAGFRIDFDAVRNELKRRWEGHGRGLRASFEKDELHVLAGLKGGVTLGSPLCFSLTNSDARIDTLPNLKAPRPGHVDLAGILRHKSRDMRAQLERASARETAARTALGAICRQLLAVFEIQVSGRVLSVAGIPGEQVETWHAAIDAAKASGDSLGGTLEVRAHGCPPGLGGFAQPVDRLDARLMAALASIPAVKGVGIGAGMAAGDVPGSLFHDPIVLDPSGWAGLGRSSNHAGGIEGGLTNGQEILLQAAVKPLPTMRKGIASVDLENMTAAKATYERSDVCVIEAAVVVAEALLCLELASALCARLGAVTVREMLVRFQELGKNESPADWPSDTAGLD